MKGTQQVKIAIPIADGRMCQHFGHCQQFAIIEADTEKKEILKTDMVTPPAHEPGVLPAWLHEQGADVIVAGGMGQRAQQLFAQNSITVIVGAPSQTAEEIATAYLNGALQAGENFCDH